MWRWVRSVLFSIGVACAVSLLPVWETGQEWIPVILAPLFFVIVVAADQKEYAHRGNGKRIQQKQEPQFFDLTRGF